ncbi:hypothetical protein B0H11DRAFT_2348673 [Mycena galericulata]|nr:hypothetical protein B0H11DRAFT_2348673 [Mycena galericulata]
MQNKLSLVEAQQVSVEKETGGCRRGSAIFIPQQIPAPTNDAKRQHMLVLTQLRYEIRELHFLHKEVAQLLQPVDSQRSSRIPVCNAGEGHCPTRTHCALYKTSDATVEVEEARKAKDAGKEANKAARQRKKALRDEGSGEGMGGDEAAGVYASAIRHFDCRVVGTGYADRPRIYLTLLGWWLDRACANRYLANARLIVYSAECAEERADGKLAPGMSKNPEEMRSPGMPFA